MNVTTYFRYAAVLRCFGKVAIFRVLYEYEIYDVFRNMHPETKQVSVYVGVASEGRCICFPT